MFFSRDIFIQLAQSQGHSAEFIDSCVRYAELLEQKKLPVIFSLQHFEEILRVQGYAGPELRHLIDRRESLYKVYKIKKRRSSGYRQIMSPYRPLKYVQAFIQNFILKGSAIHPSAFGFVPQKSIRDNAMQHLSSHTLLNIDLLKFFDFIPERRVYGVFKSLGYASNLSVDLAKLTTTILPLEYFDSFTPEELKTYREVIGADDAVLPQGAPTSPTLSNLVSRRLDSRLAKLSESLGSKYSRYADDLTFSGEHTNLPKISLIKKIVGEEGFRINWQKVGVYKRGGLQMVNGLTISNGIHVHRFYKKEINKHLYCCLKFGVHEHLESLEKQHLAFYKEWLLGRISFVNSIEPTAGREMFSKFNSINWPVNI